MRGLYNLTLWTMLVKPSVSIKKYLLHKPHRFFFFLSSLSVLLSSQKKWKYNIPPDRVFLQCFQLEIQAPCLKG